MPPRSTKPKVGVEARKAALASKPPEPEPAVDPPVEGDPWVELQRGFYRDTPLPFTGQVAQVVVHAPGTRMRRSHAVALGIDDFVVVDGPKVDAPGYVVTMTPEQRVPRGGFGTTTTKWTT